MNRTRLILIGGIALAVLLLVILLFRQKAILFLAAGGLFIGAHRSRDQRYLAGAFAGMGFFLLLLWLGLINEPAAKAYSFVTSGSPINIILLLIVAAFGILASRAHEAKPVMWFFLVSGIVAGLFLLANLLPPMLPTRNPFSGFSGISVPQVGGESVLLWVLVLVFGGLFCFMVKMSSAVVRVLAIIPLLYALWFLGGAISGKASMITKGTDVLTAPLNALLQKIGVGGSGSFQSTPPPPAQTPPPKVRQVAPAPEKHPQQPHVRKAPRIIVVPGEGKYRIKEYRYEYSRTQ